MLTTQELKKLDPKKLQEELLKAKRELFKIKFEVRNGQSKSHHLIEKKRKHIARIKTLINQQS